MDVDNLKVTHFGGQSEASLQNAAVDPLFGYIALTACDGNLHIISMSD